MSRPSNPGRFRVLLALLLVAVYLMAPIITQVQAQECIEFTVWNPQTQRCECPNQACCEFYFPFIPYGCESEGEMGENLTNSSALLQLLQFEPQTEIDGAAFLRLEFLSNGKAAF